MNTRTKVCLKGIIKNAEESIAQFHEILRDETLNAVQVRAVKDFIHATNINLEVLAKSWQHSENPVMQEHVMHTTKPVRRIPSPEYGHLADEGEE